MVYEKLFLALLGASAAHGQASRAVFSDLQLTDGQPKILYILNRGDGIVQKDLASLCGVKQSTMTGILAKMERDGLIYKESCYVSGMKRAYKIFLSDHGKDMADILEVEIDRLEEKGFKDFSDYEKAVLLKLLSKVEENMKNIEK